MCRLMPFWAPVFEEAQWSVRPVLQVRSPLEVALSLNRRDGIPPSMGCLIWLRHMLDAEAETRNTPRAVVNWDDFLDDQRRVLAQIAERLALQWPRWSDGALAEIDAFVSPGLRRQKASEEDLRAHPAVTALVRETQGALLELVEDPTSHKVQGRLNDIRAQFDDAAAIFGRPMFEIENKARLAEEEGRRAEEEGLRARAQAADLESSIMQRNAEIGDLQKGLAKARNQNEALDRRTQQLEHEFDKASQESSVIINRMQRNNQNLVRQLAVLRRNEFNGRLPRQLKGFRWFAPGKEKEAAAVGE